MGKVIFYDLSHGDASFGDRAISVHPTSEGISDYAPLHTFNINPAIDVNQLQLDMAASSLIIKGSLDCL